MVTKKFIDFLKAHNAYDAFVRNYEERLKNVGIFGEVEEVEEYLEMFEPQTYIRGTFVMDETSEGRSYWSKLEDEWLKELEIGDYRTGDI